MAVHTYLNDKAKKIILSGPSDRPKNFTDKDWCKQMTFEKAQCLQMWQGKDDFFFCHWIAQNQHDIHDSSEKVGAGQYLHTVCYEAIRFNSFFNQTGEPIVYVMDKKRKKKKR